MERTTGHLTCWGLFVSALDIADLPTFNFSPGKLLCRCHAWPADGEVDPDLILRGRRQAKWRFDDPGREFDVIYLAVTPFGAWIETIRSPAGAVSTKNLQVTGMAVFRCRETLRLLDLTGNGLAMMGETAELACFTPSIDKGGYRRSQQVAQRAYRERADLAGLLYRCRHDPSQLAVALFDRAKGSLALEGTARLADDRKLVTACLVHYGQHEAPPAP